MNENPSIINKIINSDNDDDNDNILFDHNIQIEIIMYHGFEN